VARLLDVYPARERAEDFPGVTGLLLAELAADAAPGKRVLWLPDFDAAERILGAELRDGDLCLVMGAGNVDALGRASRATEIRLEALRAHNS
jgi:UDP-N-acetylmuramate--alanine ligase